MKKMPQKYCMICGNRLDPKIHYKPDELGHASKEVAEWQKKFLSMMLKSFYIVDKTSGQEIHFESLINSLVKSGQAR